MTIMTLLILAMGALSCRMQPVHRETAAVQRLRSGANRSRV